MTIFTSNADDDAGSDEDFSCAFTGTRGKTTEHKVDNPGYRNLGKTGTWIFTDTTDIGEFRCISIRIDGTDGWLIDEVRTEPLSHSLHYRQLFPIDVTAWLTGNFFRSPLLDSMYLHFNH